MIDLKLATEAGEDRVVGLPCGLSVTVHGLTPKQRARAIARSGGVPLWGQKLIGELQKKHGAGWQYEPLALLRRSHPEAHEEIHAAIDHRARATEHIAAAGLVSCSAWPEWRAEGWADALAKIDQIDDVGSRTLFVSELAEAVMGGGLTQEGKARSAAQSGSDTSTLGMDGSVRTAQAPPLKPADAVGLAH